MEEVHQEFTHGWTGTLDVIDGDGYQAAGRMIAEKTDGLAENFGEKGVAQVRDGGETGVIDFGCAEIFGNGFGDIHENKCKGENRPDVVNARREEIVEVDGFAGPGDGNELERAADDAGIQNMINGGRNQESDDAFGKSNESQKDNANSEAKRVWSHISQQTPKLW